MTEKRLQTLLLTAHCDDAELWAGGTIRLWANQGSDVTVAIALHEEIRRQETRAAASILSFRPIFFDDGVDLEDQCLDLLQQTRPEVVVTHPPWDPHPMHCRVNSAAISALTRLDTRKEFPERWYFFDTYYLTRTSSGCPIFVDVHDTLDDKHKAISCHRSQGPEELIRFAKHMGALNGFRARLDIAEAFHPFDLLGRWPRLRNMP